MYLERVEPNKYFLSLHLEHLLIEYSNPLHLKQLHFCVKPNCWVRGTQVQYAPHVGSEPHGSPWVCLISSDEDGVRDRQKTNKSPVLQKSQDFTFICQAFVYAHLLHLRNKNL